jgi:hypothetical protein
MKDLQGIRFGLECPRESNFESEKKPTSNLNFRSDGKLNGF